MSEELKEYPKAYPLDTKVCDLCNGKGTILITIHDWLFDEPRTSVMDCLRCNGTGFINAEDSCLAEDK
jgi:DnaJ-class molecular chaperone